MKEAEVVWLGSRGLDAKVEGEQFSFGFENNVTSIAGTLACERA
jgi:hypothetical protein